MFILHSEGKRVLRKYSDEKETFSFGAILSLLHDVDKFAYPCTKEKHSYSSRTKKTRYMYICFAVTPDLVKGIWKYGSHVVRKCFKPFFLSSNAKMSTWHANLLMYRYLKWTLIIVLVLNSAWRFTGKWLVTLGYIVYGICKDAFLNNQNTGNELL